MYTLDCGLVRTMILRVHCFCVYRYDLLFLLVQPLFRKLDTSTTATANTCIMFYI